MHSASRRCWLLLAVLLGVGSAHADQGEPKRSGTLCVSVNERDADLRCSPTSGIDAAVDDADRSRTFVWRLTEQQPTVVGVLQPHQRSVHFDPAERALVRFRIVGEKRRGWPLPFTVTLTHGPHDPVPFHWRNEPENATAEQLLYLPAGDYQLSIAAAHHRQTVFSHLVTVTGREKSLGTLSLSANDQVRGVVGMAGRRDPLPDVSVYAPNGDVLATSDAHGRFLFETDHLPKFVVVTHAGFADRTVVIDAGGGDIDLGAIALDRGVSLNLLIDRPSNAAADLDIDVFRDSGTDREPRRCESVHAGIATHNRRIDHLEPGDYTLLVKGKGPLQQLTVSASTEERPVTDVTITIQPVQLQVSVVYGSEPLPGARVRFWNEKEVNHRRMWSPELVTDAGGEITEEIWQSGVISADVHHELINSPIMSSYQVGDSDVTWRIEVPKQRVIAIVRDAASGTVIASAKVFHDFKASDGSAMNRLLRVADEQGVASFSALLNGIHVFRAEAAGYYPSDPVTVVAPAKSDDENIEILLTRGKTVHVQVSDWTGTPVARAKVIDGFVHGGLNPARFLTTDDGGELLIPVRPGEKHQLCVLPQNGSFRLFSIAEGGGDDGTDVSLSVPAPAGALRIEPTAVDGRPVLGLHFLLRYNGEFVPPIILRIMAFAQARALRPDPNGVTLFDRLPAGDFEIWPFSNELELTRLQAHPTTPAATVHLTSGQMDVRLVIGGGDQPKS
jgi:hypothetical protein